MTGVAEDNDFRFLADYLINLQTPSKTAPDEQSQQDNAGFYDTGDEEQDQSQIENDNTVDQQEQDNTQQQDQSQQDQFWNDYFFNGDSLPMQVPYSTPSYSLKDFHSKGSNNGFQSFGSYEQGKNALINQLQLYQTGRTRNNVGPNSTLLQAMSVYAPAADKNDPKGYAAFIAKKLGVSVDTPISQIDTRRWADAIEKMEGNTKGNNPGNLRSFQTGGIPVARTSEEQYSGLNDDSMNELILPLEGSNIIRGLDNNHPVFIRDEVGKTKILTGRKDTAKMRGTVYEKKI